MDQKSTLRILRERYLNSEIVIELLPSLTFFVVNYIWNLKTAALAVLIVMPVAILVGYLINRKLAWLAIVSAGLFLALGALSLLFDNETFVKIGPTIGNGLFALGLLIGLAFKPSFLERVLGRQLSLTNKGWKVLTLTWVAMALAWASTNEIVWRLFSTDNWIAYKTFNDIPILLGYIIATRALAGRFWKVQSYPET